jgi:hypothetical protein
MSKLLLGLLLASLSSAQGNILASADCINYLEHTYEYPSDNFVGLSMQMLDIGPHLSNNLFQQYLMNSNVYGSWSNNFAVSLHNTEGAKFNCSLAEQLANATLNCSLDLSNATLLAELGNFSWNATNSYGLSVGWDNQAANYQDPTYMTQLFKNFINTLYSYAHQPFLLETADQANEWNATGLRPGYDYLQPEKDCADINLYVYIYYESPGVTETANSSWYDQLSKIAYECGTFTFRSVVFHNLTDLSIDSLLSGNYTGQFLKRRLKVGANNYISQLAAGLVTMNEVKMVAQDAGVDGLTNSFAAAIWAVELLMEWVIIDGFRMNFFNPIG